MPADRDAPAPVDEAGVEWLAPFSPVILKASLPAALVEATVRATDALLADEGLARELAERSPMLDNMHRHVTVPDFVLYGEDGLARYLEGLCLAYIRKVVPEVNPALATRRYRARLGSVWFNSQLAGDFIPLHLHDGNLSGIVFLRVPETLALEKEEAGHLQFFDGRPIDPYLLRHRLLIRPVAGTAYVFPSWLQHMVYPFRGAGERRSMNFNAHVFEPVASEEPLPGEETDVGTPWSSGAG